MWSYLGTSEQNKFSTFKKECSRLHRRARGNPPWHRGGGVITWLNAEWRKCWDVQKERKKEKQLKKNSRKITFPLRLVLVSASSQVVCFSHYLQRCISKGDEEIRRRQHLKCGFSKKRLEKYEDYGPSRASGMALWLKVLATKPEGPSSNPDTLKVKDKNWAPTDCLPPLMCTLVACVPYHTNKEI